MLTNEKILQIQQLLAQQALSQRAIARQLNVSRATVAAVACGRLVPRDWAPIADEPPPEPPVRCPGCGGMVHMPCRLCHVRELVRHKRARHAWQRLWQGRGPGARSSATRRTLDADRPQT